MIFCVVLLVHAQKFAALHLFVVAAEDQLIDKARRRVPALALCAERREEVARFGERPAVFAAAAEDRAVEKTRVFLNKALA